jgi:predicted nucleic acid-binding protein
MKQRLVLDAWAVLALLQREEPAADRVRQLLDAADRKQVQLFISIINLGEVYYRVGKVKGEGEAQVTLDQLCRLAITIVSATNDAVLAASRLKMRHAISYADSFAAATAIAAKATLVTGDPELAELSALLSIEKLDRRGDS